MQRYALEKLFALLLLTIAVCLLANSAQAATILVNSGIYKENVNVSKMLVLHGIDTGAGMPLWTQEQMAAP